MNNKRLILFLIPIIMVITLCGCVKHDIESVLKRENITQEDIIKIYKPYPDESKYIYLFENKSHFKENGSLRGGLITLENKKNSDDKYEITSFDIQNYNNNSESIKYVVSYYRSADRYDITRNYVVGGVEQIPEGNIRKPYIEFTNGDVLLLDSYYISNNKLYYYLDIEHDYIIIEDSKVIVSDYKVKYVLY